MFQFIYNEFRPLSWYFCSFWRETYWRSWQDNVLWGLLSTQRLPPQKFQPKVKGSLVRAVSLLPFSLGRDLNLHSKFSHLFQVKFHSFLSSFYTIIIALNDINQEVMSKVSQMSFNNGQLQPNSINYQFILIQICMDFIIIFISCSNKHNEDDPLNSFSVSAIIG